MKKGVQEPNVITFLIPLDKRCATKTFSLDSEGEIIEKSSYPKAFEYRGIQHTVNNLKELFEVLKAQQEQNCFMVNGGIIDGVDKQRMRRLTRGEEPTLEDRPVNVICLDVDGYDQDNPAEYIKKELPEQFHKSD